MDTLLTRLGLSKVAHSRFNKYTAYLMLVSLFVYIISVASQKVFTGNPERAAAAAPYPNRSPPYLASYHDNGTTPHPQPRADKVIIKHFKHMRVANRHPSSVNLQWIYHINYKNFTTAPLPTLLPNYRSPCMEVASSIKCLPAVYLAGLPKSGTSELFSKMVRHPDIMNTAKEPHWWSRARFENDLYMTNYIGYYSNASRQISKKCYREGSMCYHGDLIVDGSASTLWDNLYWKLLPGNENKDEPVTSNAYHIRRITPDVKFIVIFRNPIDRLYSDYLYFKNKNVTSPDNFHKRVERSIQSFSQCLEVHPVRQCTYNRTLVRKLPVRLHVGLYSIYVNDWLNVFPEEQFHFLSLEDYSKNRVAALKDIFKFLQLAPAPASYYDVIEQLPNINSRSKINKLKGEMRNDTRSLLRKFYMPFNRQLVDTLKDERFAYIY